MMRMSTILGSTEEQASTVNDGTIVNIEAC